MSSSEGSRRKENEERAARLVQSYYQRLSAGCGHGACTNEYCRSSPQFRKLTPAELPMVAVELARRKAPLCSTPVAGGKDSGSGAGTAAKEPSVSGAQCSSGGSSVGRMGVNTAGSAGAATSSVLEQAPAATSTHSAAATTVDGVTAADAEPMDTDGAGGSDMVNVGQESGVEAVTPAAVAAPSPAAAETVEVPPLDVDEVLTLVTVFTESGDASMLHDRVSEVFSDWKALSLSFSLQTPDADGPPSRSLMTQGEASDEPMDVDDGCRTDTLQAAVAPPPDTVTPTVNMRTLSQAYSALAEIEEETNVSGTVALAVIDLLDGLRDALTLKTIDAVADIHPKRLLNLIVILMDLPWLPEPAFLEEAMTSLAEFCALMPKCYRLVLAKYFATYSREHLEQLVSALLQCIAFRIAIENGDEEDGYLQPEEELCNCVITMEVLYAASIIGGKQRVTIGSTSAPPAEEAPSAAASVAAAKTGDGNGSSSSEAMVAILPNTMASYLALADDEKKAAKSEPKRQLVMASLHKEWVGCKAPLVPAELFTSEPLNAALDKQSDYVNFQYNTHNFSVMRYPFLMSIETKVDMLRMDNHVRMRIQRREIFHMGNMLYMAPFLKIQVRRDAVIQDALVRLEIAAADDPHSLQKQLYVEFDGEQGIDEGGVQKEFFQIIIEDLFNADFGMFTWDADTRLFWFNPTSFENEQHFSLIGMLLGLALYNNVILDVHFPMVVYRKLMGLEGIFEDLLESHPTVAKSLQQMMDYKGNDFEEVFSCTFCVGYQDMFGDALTHDLVENGSEVVVTKDNLQKYVDLYTDFLLNRMISVQFEAFKKGFKTVTGRSNLSEWFLPDDLELLICGRKELDFEAMEASTEYDGYEETSQIIVDFWSIVHALPEDQKRLLLTFCTGSDRVPIGGLKKLRFTVVRNGPDSMRLPTAHTCFNTLLLPHYATKEKLKERLLSAILHAKGFGMV